MRAHVVDHRHAARPHAAADRGRVPRAGDRDVARAGAGQGGRAEASQPGRQVGAVGADVQIERRVLICALATILEEKYGFDRFNDWFFAGGARLIGRGLWKGGDQALIDGVMVNGSAGAVGWISGLVRLIQTGHIYQYAFGMVFGALGLLSLMWWMGQRGLI